MPDWAPSEALEFTKLFSVFFIRITYCGKKMNKSASVTNESKKRSNARFPQGQSSKTRHSWTIAVSLYWILPGKQALQTTAWPQSVLLDTRQWSWPADKQTPEIQKLVALCYSSRYQTEVAFLHNIASYAINSHLHTQNSYSWLFYLIFLQHWKLLIL